MIETPSGWERVERPDNYLQFVSPNAEYKITVAETPRGYAVTTWKMDPLTGWDDSHADVAPLSETTTSYATAMERVQAYLDELPHSGESH